MVANAAHFIALARGQRTFYTAPIKALVSEKFFALCEIFGAENVGMMTGDATVNANAPIIAATTREVFVQTPKGQIEAAEALGLSPFQRFRFVVFPQAIRTILPPLGNDFVAMVKDSSLVSVLGVADITQMGKVYASGSFRFFETYSIVAYIYLILTIGLSLALRQLEKRLRKSQHR